MTPKTAPWFVHYGCVLGLYPDSKLLLTASMLKPTQTPFIAGPLGLRDLPTSQDIQRTKARVWLTPNTYFSCHFFVD